MSEVQKDKEQSMDDILASIRKIIADEPAVANAGSELHNASGEEATMERETSLGDDLSDILEPSGRTRQEGDNGTLGRVTAAVVESAGENAVQDGASWPFDEEPIGGKAATTDSRVSLQSKLASLDTGPMRDRPVAREELEPTEYKGGAEGDASSATLDRASVGKPAEANLMDGAPVAGDEPDFSSKAVVSEDDALMKPVEGSHSAPSAPGLSGDASSNEAKPKANTDFRREVETAIAGAAATVGVAGAVSKSVGKPSSTATQASEPELVATDDAAHMASVDASVDSAYAVESGRPAESLKEGDNALERIVMQALQPVLKNWLDTNLERVVREQVALEMSKRDGRGEPNA
jgi:cell pole-organizing protein PopZ